MKNLLLALVLLGCQDISAESIVQLSNGRCSGFFSSSGIIETSAHCIDNLDDEISVTYLNEEGEKETTIGTILKADIGDDGIPLECGTAVVEVDVEAPTINWCKAHHLYPIKLWAWTGDKPHREKGMVLTQWKGEYTLAFTDGGGGHSGGPVVWDGCVIGIYQGRTAIDTGYAAMPDLQSAEDL